MIEATGQVDMDSAINLSAGGEPLIILTKGKFFWKKKEVRDVKKIYERFHQWLDAVEQIRKAKEENRVIIIKE